MIIRRRCFIFKRHWSSSSDADTSLPAIVVLCTSSSFFARHNSSSIGAALLILPLWWWYCLPINFGTINGRSICLVSIYGEIDVSCWDNNLHQHVQASINFEFDRRVESVHQARAQTARLNKKHILCIALCRGQDTTVNFIWRLFWDKMRQQISKRDKYILLLILGLSTRERLKPYEYNPPPLLPARYGVVYCLSKQGINTYNLNGILYFSLRTDTMTKNLTY